MSIIKFIHENSTVGGVGAATVGLKKVFQSIVNIKLMTYLKLLKTREK